LRRHAATVGNRFEHDGERAGIAQRDRIFARGRRGDLGRSRSSRIRLTHRLRLQAEVPHHRDADVDEPPHDVDAPAAAFELHGRGAAFLQQPARIAYRLSDADLIREKRHVDDDERASCRGRRARVVQHVVERHRQRVLVSEHDHAQRVADENHIDSGAIQQTRHGRVVGGERGDLLAACLLGLQVGTRIECPDMVIGGGCAGRQRWLRTSSSASR
jgi:hypothetical protein